MGKGAKILGSIFLILGILCIGLYFVMGDKFSNYKVTFDSDGGTSIKEQVIEKGGKATKPEDPVKENNDFVEWRLDGVAYDFDKVVEKNITLKAAWNLIIKHNVKVTLEGIDYTADIREGQPATVEALNIPTKEGFLIKYFDENNAEYDLNTPVTKDIVLTANYQEIKTYTVKFNSNGGTAVDEMKVIEGQTISSPVSTKDGFILDGWYLGEEKFDFTTPISKDISLKARWNDGPRINVVFLVDGEVYKTVPVKENTTVTKPANPTKKGYRFVEWQADGNTFAFKTKITVEISLTAKFEKVVTYKVKFNSDGGSTAKDQDSTGKVTKPANPTKSGYKFVEWQLNGKAFDFDKTTIEEDIELKAIWEKEKAKFTVTFNNDDNTEITTQTVEDGGKATKPNNPTKEGYKFVEWVYDHAPYNFDTPVTQNITLTARYEKLAETPTGDVTSEPEQ